VCGGGEGEGEGKVVEQQIGALGNPCSSFSSSSPSLCIRWGFDTIFTLGNAVQVLTENLRLFFTVLFKGQIKLGDKQNMGSRSI
jgi:hypothetical protein